MLDIVHDDPAVIEKAKKLGIEPLIIGTHVAIVDDEKQRKAADTLLVLATTAERPLIEKPIDGVTRLETSTRKDHVHYRRGGLTQVEARILAENARVYVVDYSSVRHAKDPQTRIGRVLANTRICKKLGVPVILASFAKTPQDLPKPDDLEAFWRGIGVDHELARNSQKEFSGWVARARHRASENYVAEGVSRR